MQSLNIAHQLNSLDEMMLTELVYTSRSILMINKFRKLRIGTYAIPLAQSIDLHPWCEDKLRLLHNNFLSH